MKTLAGSELLLRCQISLDALGAPADHISAAMNSYGDVFCLWQHQPSNLNQVYGLYIKRNTDGTYPVPQASEVLLLGARNKGIFANDICHKPDCCVLGDDSFVAVWPRLSEGPIRRAQLEMARIRNNPKGGIEIETAAPGYGHVIRGDFNAGEGGVMPDLVGFREFGGGRVCGVVYGVEVLSDIAGATNYREYSLTFQKVTWPLSGAPTVDAAVVLVTAIPLDDTDSQGLAGGLLLPDVCLDQDEDIVVAWDEYLKASHPGQAGGDVGRVKVGRFQGLGRPSPLTAIGSPLNFQRGTTIARPQRRPMVAAAPGSWSQGENIVHLAYGDTALTGTDELHYHKINFRPATPVSVEIPWGVPLGRTSTEHLGLPSVFATPFIAGCIGTEARAGSAGRLLGIQYPDGKIQSYPRPLSAWPWRPAVCGRRTRDGKDLLAIVYEGDTAGVAGNYKTWLEVFLLP